MDAFFTIASPVPAEEPTASETDSIFADQDRLGTVMASATLSSFSSESATRPTSSEKDLPYNPPTTLPHLS
ncbi:hypothetical protein C8Q73DRAFT_795075 [Cubamyces lactineus]|nr:hypothetical protein C8Q73DRAFT_795075 [Cubamyces lactineus]